VPRIRDIAAASNDKNTGPFNFIIDVVEDDALFQPVRASGVLGSTLFAPLYETAEADMPFAGLKQGRSGRPGRYPR
jgi:hypothetical protein